MILACGTPHVRISRACFRTKTRTALRESNRWEGCRHDVVRSRPHTDPEDSGRRDRNPHPTHPPESRPLSNTYPTDPHANHADPHIRASTIVDVRPRQ